MGLLHCLVCLVCLVCSLCLVCLVSVTCSSQSPVRYGFVILFSVFSVFSVFFVCLVSVICSCQSPVSKGCIILFCVVCVDFLTASVMGEMLFNVPTVTQRLHGSVQSSDQRIVIFPANRNRNDICQKGSILK